MSISSIRDITNVCYINLESRTDRNKHVQEQLQKIGIHCAERFNAIQLSSGNGATSCSMSHLKCLENAKKNNQNHILIVEDDIEFLDPALFIKQFNSFLSNHTDDWDVVLIAGNNMIPYNKVDETCIQILNCQTTTGYLVKNHYFSTLINNFKKGINNLMHEPDQKQLYAIDKYWIRLQQVDRWFLIVPLTVVQREDYSDIEGKITNFKNYMTNMNKAIRS